MGRPKRKRNPKSRVIAAKCSYQRFTEFYKEMLLNCTKVILKHFKQLSKDSVQFELAVLY